MMKMKAWVSISIAIMLLVLVGCTRIPEFVVYEGPMLNGERVPLSVQVIVSNVASTDAIQVKWGDASESSWEYDPWHGTYANIQHMYATEGLYEIRVWHNGRFLGARQILIEGAT